MLSDLKLCQSRRGLAALLEVEVKELSYVLYKMPDNLKYQAFCISKKNGGTRNILAPCSRLKWIQSRLLSVLYECDDDIDVLLGLSPNLHYGFRRGANIFENAYNHRGKRHVFNVDIANFFDQFNFGRVRGFFLKDRDFSLHPDVSTTIAQIACFNNLLPQGSPTSPHLANLLTQFFDVRMARFLRSRRCLYSRYADDITISTNLREFPLDVALSDPSNPQGWIPSPQLADIFVRSNLPINPAKTRMSLYMSRQMVTGLVVNQRPNVTREYYLKTRAMCNRLFKTGEIDIPVITGAFGENCSADFQNKIPAPEYLKVLEGRLSHIHYIREKTDNRSIQEKQDKPTQFWTTLQNFFIYKYFVGNKKPTILTEGQTDISYLRSAIIANTALSLPEIKSAVGGNLEIKTTFFKFDTVPAEVLGLTGGSGNIKRFLYLFHHQRKLFDEKLRINPVIIVIDNDSGGADVMGMVNGIFKTNIKISDPTIVHPITDGLILLKTPHVGGKKETCIEDLLPGSVKSVVLNGKIFSPEKKFDDSKFFGKAPLAKYVRENLPSIDFTGFSEFLIGMNAAIASYKL